jgi:hypothetical protein
LQTNIGIVLMEMKCLAVDLSETYAQSSRAADSLTILVSGHSQDLSARQDGQ